MRLLKSKTLDIDCTATSKGRTALQAACLQGHVGAVRLLLKAKATVDLCQARGTSALYLACMHGEERCVSLLLDAKADPNLAADNSTAADAAHHYAHASTLELLLARGGRQYRTG